MKNINFIQAGIQVFAFAHDDNQDGCEQCLRKRCSMYAEAYGKSFTLLTEVPESRINTIREWAARGISGACTNVSSDNPVLLAPVPGCPQCGGTERNARRLQAALRGVCDATQQGEVTPTTESTQGAVAGIRPLTAEKYALNMRVLIGVLGIMTEPSAQSNSSQDGFFLNALQLLHYYALPDVAGGKGGTLEQARASCIGEGIERYILTGVLADRSALLTKDSAPNVTASLENWGYPVADPSPFVSNYTSKSLIQWEEVEVLGGNGGHVLIPADQIFCPPRAHPEALLITAGSTNGTASGQKLADATLQSLLELIERDAYWFYMRTDVHPMEHDTESTQASTINMETPSPWKKYTTTLLPNPFDIPVAQVLCETEWGGHEMQARGTGAMPTVGAAVERAKNECDQMLTSLRTGKQVEENTNDMRHLWYEGRAREAFKTAFSPKRWTEYQFRELDPQRPLEDVLERLRETGQRAYRKILFSAPQCVVVKCSIDAIGIDDPTYYSQSTRFSDFSSSLNLSYSMSEYRDTLFM